MSSLQIPGEVTETLIEVITTSKNFDVVKSHVTDLALEGYAVGDLLMKIHDVVVCRKDLTDLAKALICEKIAEVLRNIV